MKTPALFFTIILFVMASCAGRKRPAENSSLQGKADIVFDEYEHPFGKVTGGEKVSFQFTFENKGTADLVINSVMSSCGCTVPKYDSKPIHPGDKGNIEVIFNTSGYEGMTTKTITVKSNALKPVVLLRITADVESKTK